MYAIRSYYAVSCIYGLGSPEFYHRATVRVREGETIVITSYSIHYTKLYDHDHDSEEQHRTGRPPTDHGCQGGLLDLQDPEEPGPARGQPAVEPPLSFRITSYNVCYTKLLRVADGFSGPSVSILGGNGSFPADLLRKIYTRYSKPGTPSPFPVRELSPGGERHLTLPADDDFEEIRRGLLA